MNKHWGKRIIAILMTVLMIFMSLSETGLQLKAAAAGNNGPSAGEALSGEDEGNSGNNGIFDETTTYYKIEVSYPVGITEEEEEEIVLPETVLVPENTDISMLNTPVWEGHIFMGWYFDQEMTKEVPEDAKVTRNLKLYPYFVEQGTMIEETENYVAKNDVPKDYKVRLWAQNLTEEEILAILRVKNISLDAYAPFTLGYEGKKLNLEELGLNEKTLQAVNDILDYYEENPEFGLRDLLYELVAASGKKEIGSSEAEENAEEDEKTAVDLTEKTLVTENAEKTETEDDDEEVILFSEEAADLILQVYAPSEWDEDKQTTAVLSAVITLFGTDMLGKLPLREIQPLASAVTDAAETETNADEEAKSAFIGEDLLEKIRDLSAEEITEVFKQEEIQLDISDKTLKNALGLSEEDSLEEYLIYDLEKEIELVLKSEKTLGIIPSDYDGAVKDEYYLIPENELWIGGDMYSAEILDTENLHFLFEGQVTHDSVIYYNFRIYEDNYQNMHLNSDVIYIPLSEVTGVDVDTPLFSVDFSDEGGEVITSQQSGVMTYFGSLPLAVGNNLAIYDGILHADGSVDGKVTYVEIVTNNGGGSYNFKMAEVSNLIFMPDMIPLADDGSFYDQEILVEASELDFSDPIYQDFGLSVETKVEPGDSIAFYIGDIHDLAHAELVGYGLINSVSWLEDGHCRLTYTVTDLDTIEKSADTFVSENHPDIPMTDEEVEMLREAVLTDLEESGLMEETTEFISMLATDENIHFDEMEYGDVLEKMTFKTTDGEEISLEEVRKLAGGGTVKVEKQHFDVLVGANLQHFYDSTGVRLEVGGGFKIVITIPSKGNNNVDKKENVIEIEGMIGLEFEVALGLKLKSRIKWKSIWFLKVPEGAILTAGLTAGFHVGAGFNGTVQTKAQAFVKNKSWDELINVDSDFWNEVTDFTKAGAAIDFVASTVEKVSKVSDWMKKYEAGYSLLPDKKGNNNGQQDEPNEEGQGDEPKKRDTFHSFGGSSLKEQYYYMMQQPAPYIYPLDRELKRFSSRPAALWGLVEVSLSISGFVGFRINAMIGFGFNAGAAKELSATIDVFEGKATQNDVDTEKPGVHLNAYAFGMVGIRAGIRLDFRVGVLSTKLDSIGLVCEFGFYVEFYGFAYVSLDIVYGEGTSWSAMGALYFVVGFFADLKAMAQIGSGKLSKAQPIMTLRIPFFEIGTANYPIDFTIKEDSDQLQVEITDGSTYQVPQKIFDIDMLNLTNGLTLPTNKDMAKYGKKTDSWQIEGRTYEQFNEVNFIVKCSSRDFRYLPDSNTIVVLPQDPTVRELEGDITFIYTDKTFGFNSKGVSRTIHVKWIAKDAELTLKHCVKFEGDADYTTVAEETVTGIVGQDYLYPLTWDLLHRYENHRLSGMGFPEDEQRIHAADPQLDLQRIRCEGQGLLHIPVRKEGNVVELYYDIPVNEVQWRIGSLEERNTAAGKVTYFNKTVERGTYDLAMGKNITVPKYNTNLSGMKFQWYIVDNWNELISGYSGKAPITELKETEAMPDETVKLVCIISTRIYSATWMDGDTVLRVDTVDAGRRLTPPTMRNSVGRSFDHWEVDGLVFTPSFRMPAQDVVLRAIWNVNQYKITWKDGKKNIQSGLYDYGSVLQHPAVYKPCHRAKWLWGEQEIGESVTVPAYNMVLMLDWEFTAHTLDQGQVIEPSNCSRHGLIRYRCTECGETVEQELPLDTEHHAWDAGKVTVEATCSSAGTLHFTCRDCGAEKDEAYTDADAHVYDGGETLREETCSNTGLVRYTCIFCGAEKDEIVPVDPDHHLYGEEGTVIKKSTCSEQGTIRYTCSLCHATLDMQMDLDPDSHTWDQGTVTKEATCVSEGTKHYICQGCGAEKDESYTDKNAHHFDEGIVIKESNCSQPGVRRFTCTLCSFEKDGSIPLNPENHVYGEEGTVIQESTCSEHGTLRYTCSLCGAHRDDKLPLNPANHIWDKGTVTEKATCGGQGMKHYVCQGCGAEKDEPYTDKNAHVFDEGVVIKESNCTQPGVRRFTCTLCGFEKDGSIPLNPDVHVYGEEGVVIKASTCSEHGTLRYTCSLCGHVRDERLPLNPANHTWDQGTITEKATCISEGMKHYVCIDCGAGKDEPYTDKNAHLFDEGVVIKESNCSQPGVRRFTCTLCGFEKDGSIPVNPDNHVYEEEGTVVKSATCTEHGILRHHCVYCEKFRDEELPLDPMNHNWEGWIEIAPSCVSEGLMWYICVDCESEKEETIPATGIHEYDAGTVDIEPDCYNYGKIRYCCCSCDAEYFELIERTEHDFVEIERVEATCDFNGYVNSYCKYCGDVNFETLYATGHDYDDGRYLTEPTCEEFGLFRRICRTCGEYLDRDVEPLGHDYAEDIDVDPTCTEGGYTLHICSRCSGTYKDLEQPAYGHLYDEGVVTKEPSKESGPGTRIKTCERCGGQEEEPVYLPYGIWVREGGVNINMLQMGTGWRLFDIPNVVPYHNEKPEVRTTVDYGVSAFIDLDYQGLQFTAAELDENGEPMQNAPIAGIYVWEDGETPISELKSGFQAVRFIPDDPCYGPQDFDVLFTLHSWVDVTFGYKDADFTAQNGALGSIRMFEGQLVDLRWWTDTALERMEYVGRNGISGIKADVYREEYNSLINGLPSATAEILPAYELDSDCMVSWYDENRFYVPEDPVTFYLNCTYSE